MKLISMTDFVLHEQRFKEDSDLAVFKITNYANFLKQPLELWMFVPCNNDGNVLDRPKEHLENRSIYYNELREYQQEKEKCLFEGWQYCDKSNTIRDGVFTLSLEKIKDYTIEYLINLDITLSESAIKKLGI
jgi:hypothetical protein